jgi:hypothetical protein
VITSSHVRSQTFQSALRVLTGFLSLLQDAAEQVAVPGSPQAHHATGFPLLAGQVDLSFEPATTASSSNCWVIAVFRFKRMVVKRQKHITLKGKTVIPVHSGNYTV